ncbi:MAG: nitroreductase family protein [Spirochaetales bacterium]|nr:nitroreductase family protein [Spirochaetales bacterium]
MDALEAILERRSVRVFEEEKVEKSLIDTIISAGLASPSACNRRPVELIVLEDKETILSLLPGRLEAKPLKTAPLVIVVTSDTEKVIRRAPLYWTCDAAASSENMLIAATSVGLGSLWLGVWPQEDKIESIKKALSLPDNIVPFSVLAFGKEGDEGEPMWKKSSQEEKVHWEKW